MLRNTPEAYGSITKTLHWLIGIAILCLLAVGFYMTDLPDTPDKFKIYMLHKALGVTVLSLALIRIIWHRISKKPALETTLQPWEKRLAHVIHVLLYVVMVCMPLSGWIFSSAAGYPVSFFGMFDLPMIAPKSKAIAGFFREFHEYLAFGALAFIGLHVAGALKHFIIDRDKTLQRMLPMLLLLALPAHAAETQWQVDAAQSSITFTGKQDGKEFQGSIGKFVADISFDPEKATGRVVADIDITTLTAGAPFRDEQVKGKYWFDVVAYPSARFESEAFTKKPDGSYEAAGRLLLHGITLPVTLPFTLKIVNGTATMAGSLNIDRSKFSLGTGEWADTSVIANDVAVRVKLVAKAL